MPELRWTLLILGVIFVAALAWWERRRPHQASRQAPYIGAGESRPAANTEPSWGPDIEASNPRAGRDPTLTLPEIRVREPAPPRDLPVVEIPDDSMVAPRVGREPDPVEEEFADEEVEAEEPERDEAAIEPMVADAPAAEPEVKAPELPPPIVNTVPPTVEWPPEEQRTVVALRLVARPPERFQGRAVRQALAAEGFVLGALDIFHKPDAENRAVLSAASLTKPGTFDLETMDTQRFVGLNLFAVLPGPRSPQRAFEDLLLTARMLNERLEGALQDERGGPLTPTRIQAIRDGLGAEAKS
jgi:cell division protein ZipA